MATFKTRARALDMLGRQQIAGIPTAIAELFKNAHDAYADRVEVDYFRDNKLFLLRDDGIGMTHGDVENLWLALGTESKVERTKNSPSTRKDPNKKTRPILGEKGIGRLAVATLGPQVLLLTRAKREEGCQLVAAFMHWGLFEAPGVDLEQIEVPLRSFQGGTLPSKADIRSMVEEVESNLDDLSDFMEPEHIKRIKDELASFDMDPRRFDGYLDGPKLRQDGHGTHMYIKPASELLEADIEAGDETETAPPLTKLLIGFTNTMTPNHPPPVIATSFRDHTSPESYPDRIREQVFFTPEEFDMADHRIVGAFDENGTFSGTVTIYGEEPQPHTVTWSGAQGQPTKCGPFTIEVAYVQGRPRDTRLPKEDHARMLTKLNRIGGLYLYRDGIRILPYGDTDYDWLSIEKRRTFSASYYYFSYRRMFGAVQTSRQANSALQEKAGREGFRENAAYREFSGILKNFFVQTAADFFRLGGPSSDLFIQKREELQRAALVRQEREKQAKAKRQRFSTQLEKTSKRISRGEPQKSVETILQRASRAIDAAIKEIDISKINDELANAETKAREDLSSLRDSYILQKPSGFGLTRELARDWEAYQLEQQQLEDTVFVPAHERLSQIIEAGVQKAQIEGSNKNRVETVIKSASDRSRRAISDEVSRTEEALRAVSERLQTAARNAEREIEQATNKAIEQAGRNRNTERDVVAELESEIGSIVRDRRSDLDAAREQLSDFPSMSSNGPISASSLETLAVMEEELMSLRDQVDADAELVQLGTAILVINHEFNQTVSSIRRNVRRLKPWADANPNLGQLYRELRAAFEHLDGYLTLFTPLQRRLYRKAVSIKGGEIYKYIRSLFAERLKREEVTLVATREFRRGQIVGFPSTFYPVFVNLVDNALFWLQDVRGERTIRLGFDNGAFLIEDTGPGIPVGDREIIFEQGFTRKPSGRGLGLYVSRSVLEKAGYRLEVQPEREVGGACFRITPIETEDS